MRILLLAFVALCPFGNITATDKYPIEEGFADANALLIYYMQIGAGEPLVILHGGPGASHEYLLPYLLPLARNNRLIFIDERGSGRSQKIEDPSGYTIENMVEDVEGVSSFARTRQDQPPRPFLRRSTSAGVRAQVPG